MSKQHKRVPMYENVKNNHCGFLDNRLDRLYSSLEEILDDVHDTYLDEITSRDAAARHSGFSGGYDEDLFRSFSELALEYSHVCHFWLNNLYCTRSSEKFGLFPEEFRSLLKFLGRCADHYRYSMNGEVNFTRSMERSYHLWRTAIRAWPIGISEVTAISKVTLPIFEKFPKRSSFLYQSYFVGLGKLVNALCDLEQHFAIRENGGITTLHPPR